MRLLRLCKRCERDLMEVVPGYHLNTPLDLLPCRVNLNLHCLVFTDSLVCRPSGPVNVSFYLLFHYNMRESRKSPR